MERKYAVGYRKPPTHSRFKKGKSGNPKGRPKGSRNFSTDVKATLEESIRVTSHGKAKTVSTQELLSKVGDGGFQAARSISFSPSLNLTPSTISARR